MGEGCGGGVWRGGVTAVPHGWYIQAAGMFGLAGRHRPRVGLLILLSVEVNRSDS